MIGKVGRQRRLTIVATALVGVIAALVVTILTTTGGATGPRATPAGQATAAAPRTSARASPLENLARRNPGDPTALGRPDAPVVMVAYEDFRCPFCAKFSTEVAPKLRERYVATGKLRIEWRDFPIFGRQSMLAAKAARAAARQGKFWAFHDVVFAHAPERGHPEMTKAKLVRFARLAGVADIAQFKADMHDPAIARAIRRDYTQGIRIGVRSTPTFVINGTPVVGAQPLPVFVGVIEQALAQAR